MKDKRGRLIPVRHCEEHGDALRRQRTKQSTRLSIDQLGILIGAQIASSAAPLKTALITFLAMTIYFLSF